MGRIQEKADEVMNAKIICLLVSVLTLCMSAGCRSKKDIAPDIPLVVTDSNSVRTEYVETLRIDTVTVYVEVPAETAREVVSDSISHLETNYASSDAWINPDGTLGHSIANKKQSIPVDVPVVGKDTQTTTMSERIKEIPIPTPYKVEVERNFTKWETFRLDAFWYLIFVVIGLLAFLFRKPMLKGIRKILFGKFR